MTDMRERLKSIGISEARLAALGLGPPATTPTASTNPFTRARDAQRAAEVESERASKRAALAAMPDSAIERHAAAVTVYRRYRDANAIHRAHLRQNYSTEIELGRQLDELDPEPPKAAE
jgi:hypothetical protein